ncbi:MAG: glycosyltransferase family 39 protein [Gammaproteobacteria bacterium]|nr:glycosyltransferase family 39 protein [Gammaproteobacteria bacterium]
MKMKNHRLTWLKDIFILFCLIGFFFFFALGNRPLASPDEARYSEIPREMLVSGDFITPHLNGINYFEKPPLLYWAQTLSFKIGGFNEWAARTPTALFALLGCLITYCLGRYIYTRQTGLMAAGILASSLLYFSMAHVLTIDMMLSCILTASLSCLLFALNLPPSQKKQLVFCYGFYLFTGLAVLTKGLVGVLLPGAILFSWLLLLNRWKQLKNLSLFTGILLFTVIIIPWHYLVQIQHPEFFNFYIIEQQFLRFFTLSAGRYQPAWFFLVIILAGFFPWTVFLVQALSSSLKKVLKNKKKYSNELFLLLWAGIVFLFFSASKSKLIPYILPVFPPLSLLIAHYLSSHQKSRGASLLLSLLSFILLVAIYIASKKYFVASEAKITVLFLGVVLVIGTLISYIYLNRDLKRAYGVILSWAIIFNLTLVTLTPHIGSTSIKPLIMKIKTHAKPHDRVVSYHHYYQDMPFYLNRLITIVDWDNELSFGMAHQHAEELSMSSAAFWPLWTGPQTIYLVMNKRDFDKLSKLHTFYVIDQDESDALITNHPLKVEH